MVSVCITACVPKEALESWEVMSVTTQDMCVQGDCDVGEFPVVRIFPHHLVLVRGTGSCQAGSFSPCLAALSLFPSHQAGWHLTENMLLNITAVLGWYICMLVCFSLGNKVLSCCSLKLLLLLDKVSEEGIDYTYCRNFGIGSMLCFWREILSKTLWNLVLFDCYWQDSQNKILS